MSTTLEVHSHTVWESRRLRFGAFFKGKPTGKTTAAASFGNFRVLDTLATASTDVKIATWSLRIEAPKVFPSLKSTGFYNQKQAQKLASSRSQAGAVRGKEEARPQNLPTMRILQELCKSALQGHTSTAGWLEHLSSGWAIDEMREGVSLFLGSKVWVCSFGFPFWTQSRHFGSLKPSQSRGSWNPKNCWCPFLGYQKQASSDPPL